MESQIENVISRLANSILDVYLEEIRKVTRSDSPLRSITVNLDIRGEYYSISFNTPEYWKYFEYGRKKGQMPPPSVIEQWIKINKIIPKAIKGKIPTTKQLAYVIARSIGENGTEGKHTLDKLMSNVRVSGLLTALKSDLSQSINKYIYNELINTLEN